MMCSVIHEVGTSHVQGTLLSSKNHDLFRMAKLTAQTVEDGAKEEVGCKVPRGSSKCFVQTEDGKMGRECHNKQHSYWQVNKEQIWLASHKDSDVYLTVFTLRQRYNSSPGDEISLAFPPRRATRGTFASLLCSLRDCRCQLIPLWVFLPTRTMMKPLSRW